MNDKYKPDEMFDAAGRETKDISLARSLVEFRPHDFKFYVKKDYVTWFGFGSKAVRWDFHHRSDTFGSWMWPKGMPMRFDGVDEENRCVEHAASMGSSWRPGIGR